MNGHLEKIQSLLIELYGEELGGENFTYLRKKVERYLSSLSEDERNIKKSFHSADSYRGLTGKVFAIAYPDNVYGNSEPTFKTLSRFLMQRFPAINGLHILPERLMSHDDVWPQDFLSFMTEDEAARIVSVLQRDGILDERRKVTAAFEKGRPRILDVYGENAYTVIEAAYNSHFNDGGFSQKDRSMIDPRFGTAGDLRKLCGDFSVMLDFVVNHLDIDNPLLDAYRRGEASGRAFIIITPEEYMRIRAKGDLDATFRPRPFPLFTGLRRYIDGPMGGSDSDEAFAAGIRHMRNALADSGLEPPDDRITAYLSIAYKHANDQGLTSRDKRCFDSFLACLKERGKDPSVLYGDSEIQPGGMVFCEACRQDPVAHLCGELGLGGEYARVYQSRMDSCFGELFYVYTTFSESQADVNPLTKEGFALIVDDLFHLLSSGSQSMMRMDAIKYLWKEIGKKNFDMPEGDTLIDVIRLIMKMVCPETLPLDEINSPDATVYRMGKGGGFSYVFGQVNAVPIAFNEETVRPLENYQKMMKEVKSPDLLPFVMLSTHDGRSVQGIGVQDADGHVSITEFCRFRRVVESCGAKPKFRSVPKGRIPLETWEKGMKELGVDPAHRGFSGYFEFSDEEAIALNRNGALTTTAADFLSLVKELRASGLDGNEDVAMYLADWIYKGSTPYELCCTSRDSFSKTDGTEPLRPEEEADRMILAQLFVLTAGQYVPAVYLNDLLGLGNDLAGFASSGKPRDINRRKIHIDEVLRLMEEDPFVSRYTAGMNRILEARTGDPGFKPLSPHFDCAYFGETVFLNHPYHGGSDSFILGNIGRLKVVLDIDISVFYPNRTVPSRVTDLLSGRHFKVSAGKISAVPIDGYEGLWLKAE